MIEEAVVEVRLKGLDMKSRTMLEAALHAVLVKVCAVSVGVKILSTKRARRPARPSRRLINEAGKEN